MCPRHRYSIGNQRGQNLLELASIYRPTKYHLPVSVTNSTSPCLAAPSSVYPLRLPITIHLPYRTTSRRPAKTPQVEIRPAAHPQRSLAHPQTTPVYGPEFLSQQHPASSPSSVPKAGGRSDRMLGIKSEIRTPDTPNAGYTEFPTSSFRHPGTCHRKAMVAPSPNGAITGLTSPRYLKEDRPRSRNTAEAGTKPEAAPRCDRLEAVESGSKTRRRSSPEANPKRSRQPEAKGDKIPRRRG